MKIPFQKLNNGISIPVLGLGTWELTNEKGIINTLNEALALGYTHFDTAEIYMNEDEIGEAIKNFSRKKLFLVTKVWPLNLTYKGVLRSCERSLSKLGTDYIDLYLIHWPKLFGGLEEPLNAFKELYDSGKIKSFGVSNFNTKNLREVIKLADKIGLKISVNQIKLNPLNHDDDLIKFCLKNGIAVTAYSPLARGELNKNILINKLAEKYKKTTPQIILRWIIQKNIIAIPKATSKEHLKENLNIFNFKIKPADMKKIDALQFSAS